MMLDKIKKNKYQIIEIIIIFIVTLLYNLICSSFTGDEVWNYGFSYNISTGLIPYKDFNMVITPLFPMIGALFLTIFGKSFLMYHIFNSIICTTLFYYIKKLTPQNYYIIYMLLLPKLYPSYNIFCVLLLYIIMYMEDKKANNYLIGIILGITFLTKQNIGLYLCIPTLFSKDIKIIFKRIIGFIIPNIIILVYLLLNNCLYEFIDYAFLGMNSFAQNNVSTNKISIILLIIILIILIFMYIKKKDIKIIYLLCFQLLVFPMIESYHVTIALMPAIGYILNTIKINKKIVLLVFITNITITFLIHAYNIFKPEYSFPNNLETYKYRKMPEEVVTQTLKITNYINNVEDELYIISKNAYLIKLEANIKINKYDLLNYGNLGKDGEERIINEIKENCGNKKCIFLLDLQGLSGVLNNPYAQDVMNYIVLNYKQKERVEYLTVYKNY